MKQDKIPFTPAKYTAMIEERRVILIEREAVMGRLKIAREMGDLSENGAYKYAKFELGNIGRKLRELNYLIENGEAVTPAKHNTAQFGTNVTLTDGERELTFLVVSEYESDPSKGMLSMKSPIGEAILGKKIGDAVEVALPNGVKNYTVVAFT
jgi:transcription elongation GreA/GreB family factor